MAKAFALAQPSAEIPALAGMDNQGKCRSQSDPRLRGDDVMAKAFALAQPRHYVT